MEHPVPVEASPETHTMGRALLNYTQQKIPEEILDPELRHILVSATDRFTSPATPPPQSSSARNRHPFEGRHPTVVQVSKDTIRLDCFPTRNLCLHFASVIATYLSLNERRDPPITIELALPKPALTEQVLHQSNLPRLGPIHTAIIGHVHHLEDLADGAWEGGEDERLEGNIFRWKKFSSVPAGKPVALIGCSEKIWGDACYYLIQALSQLSGVQRVVYIAKAGALSEEYASNEWIATGEAAHLGDTRIAWTSPLKEALQDSRRTAWGPVATVATTLCEDQEWLRTWSPRVKWVDCEIGYMAKASNELGISFGFLHIVSDNLCTPGGEDLSNEDEPRVVEKRKPLYKEIVRILSVFLSQEADLPP